MAKKGLLLRSWLIFMPLMILTVPACDNTASTLTEETSSTSITTSPPPSTSETTPPDTSATTTNPPGNILEFEELFVPLTMKEEEIPVQVHIMTNNDTPVPEVIAEISAEGQSELDSIDYSDEFILFVFMGHQDFGAPVAGVTRIRQTDNIIYVEANFPYPPWPTVIPGFSYPKEILKVSTDNMTQFGEITFILLD